MLCREGYDDHLAGHITVRQDDGTMLVNPLELTWAELRPEDVCTIDADGHQVAGRWTVTPAVRLHVELHRMRSDIRVAIHNHPRWATIWAAAHRVPPIYEQTSSFLAEHIALHSEYDGTVIDEHSARAAAAALGDAAAGLLANHGVIVVGHSIRHAHVRAMALEWRCRIAWHVEALGGGVPFPAGPAAAMARLQDEISHPNLFEAMVRRELRADPTLLD
jgi:ribulose-5-phosphate 4-epimerase/fuculose-1-phosphate aldolase